MKKHSLAAIALALLAVGSVAYFYHGDSGNNIAVNLAPAPAPEATTAPPSEATTAQVKEFCGACHAFPPPSSFPRAEWVEQVHNGYKFLEDSDLKLNPPPPSAVLQYYQSRAPEELPLASRANPPKPLDMQFVRSNGFLPPQSPAGQRIAPAVSNVNLVHLFSNSRLDILVCDMHGGQVLVMQPYVKSPSLRFLGKVTRPSHAEVADLDKDGIKDLVVADLGSLPPVNAKVGSVVWLKGLRNGKFTGFTLLKGVGRVADVQVADFDGDKDQDLIVAVFGWRTTGEIIYLENRTTDWSHPRFVSHVIDPRPGTIHVPVTDLNGDGRPDFIALISQHYEVVEAFLNQGKGRFRKQRVYAAPHPAFASSGIQLVDFDGDGDSDVLYSNGDVFDRPPLLRAEHGIQWLENRGKFPFVYHRLTWMYGVERAVAADFDGDKDLDVVGVSFLPQQKFPQREVLDLDAVVLLEQTAPGQFIRYSLERRGWNHFSCAAGDLDGDGKAELVTGNVSMQDDPAIVIWQNKRPGRTLAQGLKKRPKAPAGF